MPYIKRQILLLITVISSFVINFPVMAHDDYATVVQLVFGENIMHWLISHQGLIFSLYCLLLLVWHIAQLCKKNEAMLCVLLITIKEVSSD